MGSVELKVISSVLFHVMVSPVIVSEEELMYSTIPLLKYCEELPECILGIIF